MKACHHLLEVSFFSTAWCFSKHCEHPVHGSEYLRVQLQSQFKSLLYPLKTYVAYLKNLISNYYNGLLLWKISKSEKSEVSITLLFQRSPVPVLVCPCICIFPSSPFDSSHGVNCFWITFFIFLIKIKHQ